MPRPQASTVAVAGGLVSCALFFGGGAGDGSIPWLGGAAVAAACLSLAWIRPSTSRLGAVAIALGLAFVAWNGLSILWSAEGDRSWDYLNRGLVYVAFAAVGLVVGALVEQRLVAGGLAGVLGLVVAWSLAGKVNPSLAPDARVARLRSPVGIWNELALLGDLALPLGLWLATSRGRSARIGGLLLIYAWTIALVLTLSRGGVLVAIVVVCGWLLLAGPKLESIAALAMAAGPGAAVGGLAFALSGVTSDGASHSQRVTDGVTFGLVALVGIALVAGLGLLSERVSVRPARRAALGRLAAVAVTVVVLGGVVVAATHASAWWNEFRNPASVELTNDPSHLASTSSNNRWRWWTEAWSGWKADPVLGNGAGTFELVHRRLRDNNQAVVEPHNLPLQFLAETGIVGGVLFVGAFAIAAAAGFRRERETVALWLGLPAYFLHGLLEVDWDFVAVTAPVLFVAGMLIARSAAPRFRPVPAFAALITTAAVVYSLFSPWLADRALDRTLATTDPGVAVREAKRAHRLNPLSIEPLRAWATAELDRGRIIPAYRLYLDEVRIQPENPDALCDVGEFELVVLDAPYRAYEHLNNWYTLDPQGPRTCLDLLDRARARVNAGG